MFGVKGILSCASPHAICTTSLWGRSVDAVIFLTITGKAMELFWGSMLWVRPRELALGPPLHAYAKILNETTAVHRASVLARQTRALASLGLFYQEEHGNEIPKRKLGSGLQICKVCGHLRRGVISTLALLENTEVPVRMSLSLTAASHFVAVPGFLWEPSSCSLPFLPSLTSTSAYIPQQCRGGWTWSCPTVPGTELGFQESSITVES